MVIKVQRQFMRNQSLIRTCCLN